MHKEEKEYNVIILPDNGKEIRLVVMTEDPFKLRDELKIKYGKNTIICITDPIAETKLRGSFNGSSADKINPRANQMNPRANQ